MRVFVVLSAADNPVDIEVQPIDRVEHAKATSCCRIMIMMLMNMNLTERSFRTAETQRNRTSSVLNSRDVRGLRFARGIDQTR
jgi:hypothetical protein